MKLISLNIVLTKIIIVDLRTIYYFYLRFLLGLETNVRCFIKYLLVINMAALVYDFKIYDLS